MSERRRRVGVLVGGEGRAGESSRRSGEAISAALREDDREAELVFVDDHLDLALRQGRFDVAFLALPPEQSRGGCVQGLLEWLGIPYTGPGVLATALAANPARVQELLRLANLPVAPSYLLRKSRTLRPAQNHGSFGFPVAVRPAGDGPRRGVGVAHDEAALEAAVFAAFRFADEVLVERHVEGTSVAVALLDGKAVGAAELEEHPGSRRQASDQEITVGRLPQPAPVKVRHPGLIRIAEKAVAALDIEGPALVELVQSERQNELVRGVDVAPSLAADGLYARLGSQGRYDFRALVAGILEGARLRNRPQTCALGEEAAPYRTSAPNPNRSRAARRGLLPAFTH